MNKSIKYESLKIRDIEMPEKSILDEEALMGESIKLKFLKIRDVEIPKKSIKTDAGIDFFVPTYNIDFINALTKQNEGRVTIVNDGEEMFIEIPARSQIKMPLGIKGVIPTGWAVVFHNKSGIATKKRLVVGAHVIDSEYREEWILNLHNLSDDNVHIRFGQKIVQGLVVNVPPVDILEITAEEFATYLDTERKGGFGSTGV